jgi:hypothetical protein
MPRTHSLRIISLTHGCSSGRHPGWAIPHGTAPS